MKITQKEKLPINLKLNLTVEEASEYSNLGITKIRELLKERGCPFLLKNGNKNLIKRKQFETYMDAHYYV